MKNICTKIIASIAILAFTAQSGTCLAFSSDADTLRQRATVSAGPLQDIKNELRQSSPKSAVQPGTTNTSPFGMGLVPMDAVTIKKLVETRSATRKITVLDENGKTFEKTMEISLKKGGSCAIKDGRIVIEARNGVKSLDEDEKNILSRAISHYRADEKNPLLKDEQVNGLSIYVVNGLGNLGFCYGENVILLDETAFNRDYRALLVYFVLPHELDHIAIGKLDSIYGETDAMVETLKRLCRITDPTLRDIITSDPRVMSIFTALSDLDNPDIYEIARNSSAVELSEKISYLLEQESLSHKFSTKAFVAHYAAFSDTKYQSSAAAALSKNTPTREETLKFIYTHLANLGIAKNTAFAVATTVMGGFTGFDINIDNFNSKALSDRDRARLLISFLAQFDADRKRQSESRIVSLYDENLVAPGIDISLNDLDSLVASGLPSRVIDQLMFVRPAGFKKEVGLIFGRYDPAKRKYTIRRLVAIPEGAFEELGEVAFRLKKGALTGLINEHAKKETRLLGMYHTHPYTKVLKRNAAVKKKIEGPDETDNIEKEIEEYKAYMPSDCPLMGLVFEPRINGNLTEYDILQGHTSQGINLFFYNHSKAQRGAQVNDIARLDLLEVLINKAAVNLIEEVNNTLYGYETLASCVSYMKQCRQALSEKDLDEAIRLWGLVMLDIREARQKEARFKNNGYVDILLNLADDIEKIFSRYIYAHGLKSNQVVNAGDVVGKLHVVEDIFALDKEVFRDDDIVVLYYPPNRDVTFNKADGTPAKIKGLIVTKSGDHNEWLSKMLSLTCALMPDSTRMLQDLNGEYVRFTASGGKTRDAFIRHATYQEEEAKDEYVNAPVTVPVAVNFPRAVFAGKDIYDLSEIDINFASFVGLKAASVAELGKHGHNIPEGLVTSFFLSKKFFETAKYIRHYTDSNSSAEIMDIKAAIEDILNGADIAALPAEEKKAAAERLRNIIINAQMPKELEDAIVAPIIKKFAGKSIILRSTFNAEDLPYDKTAGVYQSVPVKNIADNEQSRKEILSAWKTVAASMWKESAIQLRADRGFDYKKVFPAVMVMGIMDSQSGGVAFSMNTANNDPGAFYAKACHGGPAGVVDAEILGGSPAEYLLYDDGEVAFERPVSERTHMVNKDGEEIELTKEMQAAPPLSRQQVLSLLKSSLAIKELFMSPRDCEYLFTNDGKLYFVQSRPTMSATVSNASIITENEEVLTASPEGITDEEFYKKITMLRDLAGRKDIRQLLKEVDAQENMAVKFAALRYAYSLVSGKDYPAIRKDAEEGADHLIAFANRLAAKNYSDIGRYAKMFYGVLRMITQQSQDPVFKRKVMDFTLAPKTGAEHDFFFHEISLGILEALAASADCANPLEREKIQAIAARDWFAGKFIKEKDPYIVQRYVKVLAKLRSDDHDPASLCLEKFYKKAAESPYESIAMAIKDALDKDFKLIAEKAVTPERSPEPVTEMKTAADPASFQEMVKDQVLPDGTREVKIRLKVQVGIGEHGIHARTMNKLCGFAIVHKEGASMSTLTPEGKEVVLDLKDYRMSFDMVDYFGLKNREVVITAKGKKAREIAQALADYLTQENEEAAIEHVEESIDTSLIASQITQVAQKDKDKTVGLFYSSRLAFKHGVLDVIPVIASALEDNGSFVFVVAETDAEEALANEKLAGLSNVLVLRSVEQIEETARRLTLDSKKYLMAPDESKPSVLSQDIKAFKVKWEILNALGKINGADPHLEELKKDLAVLFQL